MKMNATYSPDDNKLRLYASSRLDTDTYNRVKAQGFRWAAAQGLFVAPMWTPAREDILIELCGEIDDEDTSLVERSEQRAERFETYSDKRANEADRAHAAVSSIADGIPLGQPILVGHHSEKHARRDAEKIQNGIRKAIHLWDTAKYWEQRAAGALGHAKYKELPPVRARRIKGLERDLRKFEQNKKHCEGFTSQWAGVENHAQALLLANHCQISQSFPLAVYPRLLPASQYEESMSLWSAMGGSEGETHAIISYSQAKEIAVRSYGSSIANSERWITHYTNRLAYERAMLVESGGLKADKFDFKPGGKILRRGTWYIIPESLSVFGHFAATVSFDEVQDYQAPTEEGAAAVAKVSKLPPICNYPGEGFKHMTREQLDAEPCRKWSDFAKVGRIKATDKYAAHRIQQTRGASAFSVVGVFITDAKRKDPPFSDVHSQG